MNLWRFLASVGRRWGSAFLFLGFWVGGVPHNAGGSAPADVNVLSSFLDINKETFCFTFSPADGGKGKLNAQKEFKIIEIITLILGQFALISGKT